jgi:hypothetical protein
VNGRRPRPLAVLCVAVVAIFAAIAIAATCSQLSQARDERILVVGGRECLQDGRDMFQAENPPPSRVMLASLPSLERARLPSPEQRPSDWRHTSSLERPTTSGTSPRRGSQTSVSAMQDQKSSRLARRGEDRHGNGGSGCRGGASALRLHRRLGGLLVEDVHASIRPVFQTAGLRRM